MANEGRGWLTISIDLELDIEKRARSEQRVLETAARRLLSKLDDQGLTATWAVADPAHSAATEAILSRGSQHEIAILGDRTWVGRGAGRTRFSRELARRVEGARSAGITVASLALQSVDIDEHLDLLVKHRIVVLRDGVVSGSPAEKRPASRWSRYGVWRPPVSCRIPCERPWWQGGALMAVRQALAPAAQVGGLSHVVIDGSQLIDAGESGFDAVEMLLREVNKRLRRGQLAVGTLAQVARRIVRHQAATPMRSILRPAA